MENGFFQTRLKDLHFSESFEHKITTPHDDWETQDNHMLPPIPTEMPLAKLNSLDSLIQQNEDLAARLKVNIRRLSMLEAENYELSEKSKAFALSNSNLQDQLLIWKEKETAWMGRIQSLERKTEDFEKQFPEYLTMKDTIERHKRYQERIKLQVKPYIQQLKDYSERLIGQIKELNGQLSQKDNHISELEMKLKRQNEEFLINLSLVKQNENHLTQVFEKERSQFLQEIKSLRDANSALEIKTSRLNQSLERQDDLENQVIALNRVCNDLQTRISSDFELYQNNLRSLRQELGEKSLHLENCNKELTQLKTLNEASEKQKSQMEEQLNNLRYLWNQKNEENEKLHLQISALEKINAEISRKLNESRKGEVFV